MFPFADRLIRLFTIKPYLLFFKAAPSLTQQQNEKVVTIGDGDEKKEFNIVNLAPTRVSDSGNAYVQGLVNAALDNEVTNIGVTGIYGAGKSTVIDSFLNQAGDKVKALLIKLGSYQPDANEASQSNDSVAQPSDADLEVRILQQILFSAASDELPYSRFRRIKVPSRLNRKTFLATYFLGAGVYLFSMKSSISTVTTLDFGFWCVTWIVLSMLSISFLGVRELVKVFTTAPITKFSLKNLEFEAANNETSTLNKYLDELLYFFEVTDLNTVIFEDLDRFEDKQIFNKLRELNTLINNNNGIKKKKTVTFIYALKDSMFKDQERTKFFGEIVPIVPVVNLKNSSVIINERLNNFKENGYTVDESFVFAISQYLNDARLIHNVFNEMVYYLGALNTELQDITRLLATLLYKNLFVEDFERTQDGQSLIDRLIRRKAEMIRTISDNGSQKAAALRNEIELLEAEYHHSERSLYDAFATELFRLWGPNDIKRLTAQVRHTNKTINSIYDTELLQKLSVGEWVQNLNALLQSTNQWEEIGSRLKIKETLAKVTRGLSIQERVAGIHEQKYSKLRELRRRRGRWLGKVRTLESKKLFKLLEDYPDAFEQELSLALKGSDSFNSDGGIDFTIPRIGLLRFLVFNGYLGEEYRFYTSVFYESKNWTNSDESFLKSVLERLPLPPSHRLRNPSEVSKHLSASDYSSRPVLNFDLIHYLCETESEYLSNVTTEVSVAIDDDGYHEFIPQFLHWKMDDVDLTFNGAKRFLQSLVKEWPGYIEHCFNHSNATLEGALFLHFLSVEDYLETDEIDYIQKSIENQLWEFMEFSGDSEITVADLIDPILELDIKVTNLTESLTLSDQTMSEALVSKVIDNLTFAIASENIVFILERNGVKANRAKRQTLTSLIELNDKRLNDYILNDVEAYLEKVMFANEENDQESEEAIKYLFNKQGMTEELVDKVTYYQESELTSLDDIPTQFIPIIASNGQLSASWTVVNELVPHLEPEALEQFLENAKWHGKGTAQIDHKVRNGLVGVISNLDGLSTKTYIELLLALDAAFDIYPEEASMKKWLSATEAGIVRFSESTLQTAIEHEDEPLLKLLLLQNENQFAKYRGHIAFSPTLTAELLKEFTTTEAKQKALEQVRQEDMLLNAQLTSTIAETLLEEVYKIESSIIATAVVNAESNDIGVLLIERYQTQFDHHGVYDIALYLCDWASEQTFMKIVAGFRQSELSGIASYGKKPKVANNTSNRDLLEQLKRRRFISSYRQEGAYIRVNTKRRGFRSL